MSRPDSPCVALCSTALGDEVCMGCSRTFFEVANWVCLSDTEKEAVWRRLESHWAEQGLPAPWHVTD